MPRGCARQLRVLPFDHRANRYREFVDLFEGK
jgi:hypothetical protein